MGTSESNEHHGEYGWSDIVATDNKKPGTATAQRQRELSKQIHLKSELAHASAVHYNRLPIFPKSTFTIPSLALALPHRHCHSQRTVHLLCNLSDHPPTHRNATQATHLISSTVYHPNNAQNSQEPNTSGLAWCERESRRQSAVPIG
jgi:hypothetical protein